MIEATQNPLDRTLDMSALSEELQGVLTMGPATFPIYLYDPFQKLFLPQ